MYQTFERGQMVWTPNQGANMIVSGYTYTYWTDQGLRAGLVVQYAASDPFNYDSWPIRLDRNGYHLAQWECWVGWPYPCGRTGGSWVWAPVSSGLYRIVVEGCDVDAWNGHTCRQGWTMPIHVWVAQP